jgi:hypothetical protein
MFLLFPILRRLLFLAAFLAVLAVGAELLARKLIGDAVTHAIEARIGVAPKVGFGSTPLVVQIARGSLQAVTVSARGARVGGLPPMSLRATLRDVHLSSLTSLEGAIGSLRVYTWLPPAGVRDLLATPACIDSLPAGALATLTREPRIEIFPGRIDLLPASGRTVEVRLRPLAEGSSVRFEVIALELDGVPAPRSELLDAQRSTTCSRSLSELPFGISLVRASATDGSLELAFVGAGASFSAIG